MARVVAGVVARVGHDGPMTDVALVVNPTKVEDVAALHAQVTEAMSHHGWPPPRLLTTTEDDPGSGVTEQAVRDGAQFVVAAGGDGTVAAVISGLAGTDVALVVLPSGTGNLLARNIDLPTDVDQVVAALVGGRSIRIDVGEVVEGPGTGSSFAVMAGLGFDAEIMTDAPERMKALMGWPAYVVAAAGHLTDEPFHCRIVVDGGEPIEADARTVIVANAGGLPGGVDLAPDAGISDGLLDVVVVSPQSVVDWVRLGARLAVGSQREDERLERAQGRRVEITTDDDQVCQLDGDPIAPTRRFTVEVRPHALLVRMPAVAG